VRELVNGLIVLGDLHDGENTDRDFFFTSGLTVMGDLSRWENTKKGSHCNG
jgi:hypothetical protein